MMAVKLLAIILIVQFFYTPALPRQTTNEIAVKSTSCTFKFYSNVGTTRLEIISFKLQNISEEIN